MKTLKIVMVAFVLTVTSTITFSKELSGSWSSATPLPQPRAEHAVVTLEDMIYVVAGGVQKPDGEDKIGGGASTLVEVYDSVNDQWQLRAPLPRALTHVGLAAVDGKIYSIGGFIADIHKQAQKDAFVYDPATDTWNRIPSLPSPRGSVATVALNGKIHAIGGRNPQDELQATHEIYDPEKQIWTSAKPLPVARDHASIVAVDGKIHVIGGRTGDYDDVTDYHDVYDPAADSWSKAPPMPTARSATAATVYQNMIVVFGGECHNENTFSVNEGYDLAEKQWKTLESVKGRHGFGTATIDDRVYFVAGARGCGGDGLSKEMLVFTLP